MKTGDIIVPIKYHHFADEKRFKEDGMVIGRPYECIGTLKLTSSSYYIPEFASLPGVTIIVKRSKYGLKKVCIPMECFRLATIEERREWLWNPPKHDWIRGGKQLKRILKKLKSKSNGIEH